MAREATRIVEERYGARVFVARLDGQIGGEAPSSRTRVPHRRRINEADVKRAMRRLSRSPAY